MQSILSGKTSDLHANFIHIANIVCFDIVNILTRLSSGEKLGVLSQGPTIVYDVKMLGLKVNLETQDKKMKIPTLECFSRCLRLLAQR